MSLVHIKLCKEFYPHTNSRMILTFGKATKIRRPLSNSGIATSQLSKGTSDGCSESYAEALSVAGHENVSILIPETAKETVNSKQEKRHDGNTLTSSLEIVIEKGSGEEPGISSFSREDVDMIVGKLRLIGLKRKDLEVVREKLAWFTGPFGNENREFRLTKSGKFEAGNTIDGHFESLTESRGLSPGRYF